MQLPSSLLILVIREICGSISSSSPSVSAPPRLRVAFLRDRKTIKAPYPAHNPSAAAPVDNLPYSPPARHPPPAHATSTTAPHTPTSPPAAPPLIARASFPWSADHPDTLSAAD